MLKCLKPPRSYLKMISVLDIIIFESAFLGIFKDLLSVEIIRFLS